MHPFSAQFSPLSFPLLGLVRLPKVTLTPELRTEYEVSEDTPNRDVLKWIVWKGYKAKVAAGRFGPQTEKEVIERLRFEFEVFEKTGIIDYLLMVFDFTRWCDDNGIARGAGRGSVTGSLSCFCAGITRVNPLTYNLNFTRFISEARAKPQTIDGVIYAAGKSMCDIDCDISFSQRHRVLTYLDAKYPGRTAKICNRLELTGKMALKDVLKTYLGYGEDEAMGVTGHIEAIFGKVETLSEAYERHPELRKWVDANPRHREAFDIAQQIMGLGVTKGVHASGVFVSYDPVDGNIPVEAAKNGDTVTSYDMNMVAELGVKLDCLALKTVDVVEDTCKLVGVKSEDIDINDPSIYRYLATSDQYYGLFQIESGVTKDVVTKLNPRHVDDLAAALAVGRPGSLRFKDDLIAYVKTGKMKSIYPPMDELMKDTAGIVIYQETINEVCQRIYGMSAVDADEVRRAISKKQKEDMAKWEPILYANGEKRGVPKAATEHFWQSCNASADYLFSRNHCYGYVTTTAQTVYLKANHPQAFMLSLFRMAAHEANTQECLSQIIGECRKMGVSVLPPDILRSSADFTLEKDETDPTLTHIRFGLGHVRGISDSTMEKMAAFRSRPFTSKLDVFEAAKSAGINITVLSSLILSGCLNWKGEARTKLALEAQTYNLLSDTQKAKVKQFAGEYGEDLVETLKGLPSKLTEKGKPIIPESQLETLRRKYAPYWVQYQQNSRNEELAAYTWERHLLGFSYTSSLWQIFSRKVVGLLPLSEVLKLGKAYGERNAALPPDERAERADPVSFVCYAEEAKLCVSQKNGTPYLKLLLSDDSGSIRALLYGQERVDSCKRANGGELPKEGALLSCEGSFAREGSMLFLDTLLVQDNPIHLKRGSADDIEV